MERTKEGESKIRKTRRVNVRERAITLVALVVTIVIMLILAGVTIAAISGDNGIIAKANKAKLMAKIAQISDEIQLQESNKWLKEKRYLTNYEIKDILDKEGEINRATISIDGTPVPVEDILGEYSNKKTSNHVLAGYWENWVDNPVNGKEPRMKLSDVSPLYEIINVTFARNDNSKNNGAVEFHLNEYLTQVLNYKDEDFINDIKTLQKRGKKVLISVGGQEGGNIPLTNDDEVKNFADSLSAIIDKYNFNGLDIDIESGTVDEKYLEKALLMLSDKYASNIMITLNSSLSGIQNKDVNDSGEDSIWYTFAENFKDMLSITSSRYYNTGTKCGEDYNYGQWWSREQGHVSFITSVAIRQLEDKNIANGNIGISILAFDQVQGGGLLKAYMEPEKIVDALTTIMEGKKSQYDTDYRPYNPKKAYPELKAVTIWSINKDYCYDYAMAKAVSEYLSNF